MRFGNLTPFAILLAAGLAAGCTVHVHPQSQPPAETDVAVNQPAESADQDQAEIGDRRRVPPTAVPRRPQEKSEPVTDQKPGNGPKRDHPVADDQNGPRRKQPPGKEKDEITDPPSRPGVGKGRDESKSDYPGKGKAHGLEKQEAQDDKAKNQGQGQRNKTDNKPDNNKSQGSDNAKNPEKNRGNANAKSEQPNQGGKAKPSTAAGKPQQQPKSQSNPAKPKQPTEQESPNSKAEKGNQPGPQKQPATKQPKEQKGANSKGVAGNAKGPDKQPTATKQQNEPQGSDSKANGGKAERPQKQRPPEKTSNNAKERNASNTNDAGPSAAATLPVGSQHLPSLGKCRVWIQGKASSKQAKARNCKGIDAKAPAGAWVLYRPADDRKVVHVRIVDPTRAGVVMDVHVYEFATGKLLRREQP